MVQKCLHLCPLINLPQAKIAPVHQGVTILIIFFDNSYRSLRTSAQLEADGVSYGESS